MDVMGHALKKKMHGIQITISPAKHDELHDDVGKVGHQDPDGAPNPHLDADQDMDHDKENSDLAPDVKDHGGDEMMMLNKMIGDGNSQNGDPLRPMTLGERAKSKMKERMSSIQKEKGLKGKY